MMAGPNALLSFLTKFTNLWHAGKNAQLSMECKNGDTYVNLRLHLDSQPPAPQHPYYPPPRRQPGPSRVRRRVRRAVARAEAAENAAVSTENFKAAAEATAPIVPQTCEAAVQAVPFTPEAAVQAADLAPPSSNAAVQAADLAPPSANAAVQADDQQPHGPETLHHHRPPHGAAQALLSAAVQDVFCPDRDFMMASRAEYEQDRRDRYQQQREEDRRLDLEKFQKMVENSFKL